MKIIIKNKHVKMAVGYVLIIGSVWVFTYIQKDWGDSDWRRFPNFISGVIVFVLGIASLIVAVDTKD